MNSKNDQEGKKHEWYASGNAPRLYPTELVYGNYIFPNGKKLYIPESIPFVGGWGEPVSMHSLNDGLFPAPSAIEIIWLSVIENQFYYLEADLPFEIIDSLLSEKNSVTKEQKYNFIVAGMAPYGGLAVWLSGAGIRTEIAWLQAEPTEVNMKDFAPAYQLSQKEYSESTLVECKPAYANFIQNGMPDRMLFEQYMQRFNYRFTPQFENKEVEFKQIDLFYYNGELNSTNTGDHQLTIMRAKPYKMVLTWNIGKTEYIGFFWTDEKKIIETFSDFYDKRKQDEGSFVIEVKESNKEFQFFLQNDNFKIEIPQNDFHYIIFKNDFEFHRSKNYNRPPGGFRN